MNPFEDESSKILEKERKYRNYCSEIEKILRQFENTSEWADTIPLLVRLTKVLGSYKQYETVPHKLMLCKRLAQCLHHNMPSGVHEKTLECYTAIFSCVQRNELQRNLHIYLFGLLPLLTYCGSSVKQPLIKLYEDYVLPLGTALKPCMQGLLLALLPGLEEASDHINRITLLLKSMCSAVGASYFYTALWRVLIDSPSVRLSGLNFVLGCYNRKRSLEDQLDLIGHPIDNMVRSLCSVLSDSNTLVQRQALEFMLNAFPLHQRQQLSSSEFELLCSAAFNILLKRDASLNRRFYTWLGDTADYFEQYSKAVCVQAYANYVQLHAKEPIPAFRVLQSLVEKLEVGKLIISDTLIMALRLCRDAPKPEEAGNSLGQLLASLDTKFLSEYFTNLFTQQLDNCIELSGLVAKAMDYCLENDWNQFQIDLIQLCSNRINELTQPMLLAVLQLTNKLLQSLIKETIELALVNAYRNLYLAFCKSKLSITDEHLMAAPKHIADGTVMELVLSEEAMQFHGSLEMLLSMLNQVASCELTAQLKTDTDKSDNNNNNNNNNNNSSNTQMPDWLIALLASSCYVKQFQIRSQSAQALIELLTASQCLSNDNKTRARASTITDTNNSTVSVSFPTLSPELLHHLQLNTQIYWLLTEAVWCDLADESPACRRSAARLFAQLAKVAEPRSICEDKLLSHLCRDEANPADAYRRFINMWLLMEPRDAPLLSRCILVMFDCIGSGKPIEKLVTDWVEHALQLQQLSRLLDPLLQLLLNPNTSRLSVNKITSSDAEQQQQLQQQQLQCEHNRWQAEEARIVGIESDGSGKVVYKIDHSYQHGQQQQQQSQQQQHQQQQQQQQQQLVTTALSSSNSTRQAKNSVAKVTHKQQQQQQLQLRLCENPMESEDTEADCEDADGHSENGENRSGGEWETVASTAASIAAGAAGAVAAAVRLRRVNNSNNNNNSNSILHNDKPIDPATSAFVNEIVNELVTAAIAQVERTVHPLFNHLCLYTRHYDWQQVSYVLTRLIALLTAAPKLLTAKLAEASVLPQGSPLSYTVFLFYLRHIACEDGGNFFQDPSHDLHTEYKGITYLQLLAGIAMYFTRSCYSPYSRDRISQAELVGNKIVQLRATELLSHLLLHSSGSTVAERQLRNEQLQLSKYSLHSACAALSACYKHWTVESHAFSAHILHFNDAMLDQFTKVSHTRALVTLLLRLLRLESGGGLPKPSEELVFQDKVSLAGQPMFRLTLELGLSRACHTGDHVTWYGFVCDLLPHCDQHLASIVTLCVACLCDTLDECSAALSSASSSLPADLCSLSLNCLHRVLQHALSTGATAAAAAAAAAAATAADSHITKGKPRRDCRTSAQTALPRCLRTLLRLRAAAADAADCGRCASVVGRPHDLLHRSIRLLQLIVDDDKNEFFTAAAKAGLQQDAQFVSTLQSLLPLDKLLDASRFNQAALRPTVCVAKQLTPKLIAQHTQDIQALLKDPIQQGKAEVAFLLLELYHVLVASLKAIDKESRGRRDLQDLANSLVANVAGIAGNTVEKPGWFKATVSFSDLEVALSVRAIKLMEAVMFLLLDHVFGPSGDRVDSVLSGQILKNCLPHLKQRNNASLFHASSGILREISRKDYTRKSWKRDAVELYLEPVFFRLKLETLRHWLAIIDNLMGAEFKQTFKEIFSRLTVSFTANLFANKEQEWEQRSCMVKRLGFMIFSGELDQYVAQLQEVLGFLTENLRVSQSAWRLQASVLLCFRVLLLRVSAVQLAPMWYVFVPELYAALWQLQNEPDWFGVPPARLELYLAVMKLLDCAVQLPEAQAALLHTYRWSFIGDVECDAGSECAFVPLINKIVHKMCHVSGSGHSNNHNHNSNSNMTLCCGRLAANRIGNALDLLPFLMIFLERFDLVTESRMQQQLKLQQKLQQQQQQQCLLNEKNAMPTHNEELLLRDFLERD